MRSEEKTDEDGKKFTVYYFNDEGMLFDPNKNEIAGLVKRISFQTGDLAGQGNSESNNYWFEANYNSDTLEWEIINTYPSDDIQIPGGNLVPPAGRHVYSPGIFACQNHTKLRLSRTTRLPWTVSWRNTAMTYPSMVATQTIYGWTSKTYHYSSVTCAVAQ